MKRIEFDEVCPSCDGTGLYSGEAERDGSAVVCHTCKGTGRHHFVHDYEEFKERALREGVKRVFQCNPGICVGEGQGYKLSDFGGQPFEDWNKGKPFPAGSEMRRFTCPRWWGQCSGGHLVEWDECDDSLGLSFSHCPHFLGKGACWDRYDKEISHA